MKRFITHEELARSALGALSSQARKLKLRLLAPPAPVECLSTVPWLEPAGEALVLDLIDDELRAGRAVDDRVYLLSTINRGGRDPEAAITRFLDSFEFWPN